MTKANRASDACLFGRTGGGGLAVRTEGLDRSGAAGWELVGNGRVGPDLGGLRWTHSGGD